MPRVVDADQRRAEIVDAVWRVIARDGLDQASVRSVAREAGLSVGSLRHSFGSQAELLAFTLDAVGERLEARLTSAGATGDPLARVRAKVDEMLPLDPERRRECEVWLAFTARALVDDSLRKAQRDVDRRLSEAFRYLVGLLAEAGLLREDSDLDVEAERLNAVVDGLIVHGLTRRSTPKVLRSVVDAHLAEITRP